MILLLEKQQRIWSIPSDRKNSEKEEFKNNLWWDELYSSLMNSNFIHHQSVHQVHQFIILGDEPMVHHQKFDELWWTFISFITCSSSFINWWTFISFIKKWSNFKKGIAFIFIFVLVQQKKFITTSFVVHHHVFRLMMNFFMHKIPIMNIDN